MHTLVMTGPSSCNDDDNDYCDENDNEEDHDDDS